MSEWHFYQEAPCGRTRSVTPGFEDPFFAEGLCRRCGEYHSRSDFELKATRTVFHGTWWKPWTWRCLFEDKEC